MHTVLLFIHFSLRDSPPQRNWAVNDDDRSWSSNAVSSGHNEQVVLLCSSDFLGFYEPGKWSRID
jgi:hypothetical protein